jgi:hypothetical protein
MASAETLLLAVEWIIPQAVPLDKLDDITRPKALGCVGQGIPERNYFRTVKQ